VAQTPGAFNKRKREFAFTSVQVSTTTRFDPDDVGRHIERGGWTERERNLRNA
jgi:hypothetical protein